MSVAVPHYVYRCFDADGVLLYVGCTSHVKTRLAAHRTGAGTTVASRWLQVSMARYEVSARYPTKRDALDVEANAIMDERPLFNLRGRRIESTTGTWEAVPTWQILAGVADYLIPRGHGQLAADTTCMCWNAGGVDSICYTHRTLATAISTRRAQADEAAA